MLVGGLPWRRLQEWRRTAAKLLHLEVLVHQDGGRRIATQRQAIRFPHEIGRLRADPPDGLGVPAATRRA